MSIKVFLTFFIIKIILILILKMTLLYQNYKKNNINYKIRFFINNMILFRILSQITIHNIKKTLKILIIWIYRNQIIMIIPIFSIMLDNSIIFFWTSWILITKKVTINKNYKNYKTLTMKINKLIYGNFKIFRNNL